jgi:hypothetical protein
MTTRAARIWNGTAWEDLAAPVGVAPVSYQSTEPPSPQTGDIWIDSSTNTASSGIPVNYQAAAPVNPSIGTIWIESDVDVPSVGQNLSYRWRRIAGGGETSLAGNDSFGLPLTYTPGYEQFFLNGMLLYRGSDYIATTGTTITGFPALTAGDVIEVLAIKAEPLADTYTQAQADSKYATNSRSGLTLVVPTSITVGSGSASTTANGAITFTGASSVSLNGCFNSTYDNYQMTLQTTAFSGSGALFTQIRLRNASDDSSANWYTALAALSIGNSTADPILGVGATQGYLPYTTAAAALTYSPIMEVMRPFLAAKTSINVRGYYNTGTRDGIMHGVNQHDLATSYSGISFFPNTGTFTGTIRIYGYNNGTA